jgi:GNAT superfamily N-acetyltransferase
VLDKTISYKHIIMRMDAPTVQAISPPVLPEGYTFRFFQPGDEKHWARIEASVLEFDSESEALEYFKRDYLPYLDELERRCVFVCRSDGLPVATATAWFAESKLGYQASLHWVSVCPEYQGKGLGKAVVKKALSVFLSTDPGKDIWLHTQTWSHVAVRLYYSLGFKMQKSGRIAVNTNSNQGTRISHAEFEESIQVLRDVYDSEWIDALIRTAE